MRVVVMEPPARNTLTGGYLYNAQLASAAPAGTCVLRACSVDDLRRELQAAPGAGDLLVLDSLYLPELDPAAWRGRRVVHLVHSLPAGCGSRADLALGQALGCVTTSAFMAETVRARVPSVRTRVCRPGVVARPHAVETPAPVPVVLTVANFERRKGHLSLLRALSGLRDLPFTWEVVGDLDADAECAAEFAAAVDRSGLADRVCVRGVCSPRDVQRAMASAAVFALLSVDEPYGMVYAESIAHGTPVIAWRQGGVLEIVDDGSTGLLAAPGDVEGAAAHLRRLLSAPGERARMRQHCARAAATLPSWEACAREFLAACRTFAEVCA